MDLQTAMAFVGASRNGVLTTLKADGRPQLSNITYVVGDDGVIRVSITDSRAKTKNLRRDPRATVCVFNDGFFGEWVQIDGTAAIVPTADAIEGLVALYRQIGGEHPDWDDYRAAMLRERRVLLLISIDE